MKVTMFGSNFCQDTLFAMQELKAHGIAINFMNISTNFPALKAFMNKRMSDPIFEPVIKNDGIGMPFFVFEDGSESLDYKEVIARAEGESMTVISTDKAPGAIGPYSQAFETGGVICTSGQIPVNPETGAVPEGIASQAEQSCKNVGAILNAAGCGFEQVFKTTCFLADMADFAAFNEVYSRYFVSKPARSCVAVKSLPKGVLCEIEALARKA